MSIRTEQAEAWWANHCADLYDESDVTQLSLFIQEIEAELYIEQAQEFKQQAMREEQAYQEVIAEEIASFDPVEWSLYLSK